jgi:hypothetical protein
MHGSPLGSRGPQLPATGAIVERLHLRQPLRVICGNLRGEIDVPKVAAQQADPG